MAFVERQASTSKPKRKGKPAPKIKTNVAKRETFNNEIKDLQKRIDTFDISQEITTFDQLPLSSRTLKGLKSSHFVAPTPIQSKGIPPSLLGRDVLGSAKTGSGKTLAFLIPLLERLYLLKWGPMDGLGAVVISPTRELAVQTFTALRDIGKYHNFSAGLVIGGKPLKEEKDRLGRMNILVATPGRLLQHLDSTVGFESAGLKLLVLDEADRLLDLGFLPALRAIITHFGTQGRQTLLFSATQTSDLASLAKLSLRDPLYINCNKVGEEGVTPASLEQFYSVIPLPRKLDALWGFVKSHLKMKGVVFVTSGKQVRFIFESFRKLHPGLPVMHLHGKQKQVQRLTIFQKFSASPTALLVTTDVSARGLDFPSVDWVVQLDCPEDVDTYIHRVGRTARYKAEGKGLIFLCPSEEEGMTKRWEEKGVVVKQIKIKEAKMGNLKQSLQNFSFREPEIKYLGQRAFISYMRSLHIQKDKTIFDFSQYPAEEFAASLGLPGAPQIKLNEGKGGRVRGGKTKEVKEEVKADLEVVASSDEEVSEDEEEEEGEEEDKEEEASVAEEAEVDEAESEEEASGSASEDDRPLKAQPVRTKFDRMFERTNQSILTPHYSALISHEDADEDDDIFTLARPNHTLEEHTAPASDDLSKRKLKAAASKKGQVKNRPGPEKVIYDEEGNEMDFYKSGVDVEAGAAAERDEFLEAEKERMRAADKVDREVAREKKREKKRKRKEREREVREMEGSDSEEGYGGVAVIGGLESGSEDEERDEVPVRAEKRRKEVDTLEDEEALALRLLGQSTNLVYQTDWSIRLNQLLTHYTAREKFNSRPRYHCPLPTHMQISSVGSPSCTHRTTAMSPSSDDRTPSLSPTPEPVPKRKRAPKPTHPKPLFGEAHATSPLNPYTLSGIPFALNHVFDLIDTHGGELPDNAKAFLLDTDLPFPLVVRGKGQKMKKALVGRYTQHGRALFEALKVVCEAVSAQLAFSWEDAYLSRKAGKAYRPGKPGCWMKDVKEDSAVDLRLPEDVAFFTMLAVFGADALKQPLRKSRTLLDVHPDIHSDTSPARSLRVDLYENLWLPFAAGRQWRFAQKVQMWKSRISSGAVESLREDIHQLGRETRNITKTCKAVKASMTKVVKRITDAESSANALSVNVPEEMQMLARSGRKQVVESAKVAKERLKGRVRNRWSREEAAARGFEVHEVVIDAEEIARIAESAEHHPVQPIDDQDEDSTDTSGGYDGKISAKRAEVNAHFARLGVLEMMNKVIARPDHQYFLSPATDDPEETDEDTDPRSISAAQLKRNEEHVHWQKSYERSPLWSEGKQVLDLVNVPKCKQRFITGFKLRMAINYAEADAGLYKRPARPPSPPRKLDLIPMNGPGGMLGALLQMMPQATHSGILSTYFELPLAMETQASKRRNPPSMSDDRVSDSEDKMPASSSSKAQGTAEQAAAGPSKRRKVMRDDAKTEIKDEGSASASGRAPQRTRKSQFREAGKSRRR